MSNEALTAVWKHSPARGGKLLVMLALADYADEHGWSYPSVGTLAKKARLSVRAVQFAIRTLVDEGQLTIDEGGGPMGVNRYQVVVGGGADSAGVQILRGEASFTGGVKTATRGGAKRDKGGEAHFTGGVKPASPNPSRNPQEEPSEEPPPEPPARAAAAAAQGEASESFTAQVAPALVQATGFRGTVAGGKTSSWLGQCLGILGEATGDDPTAALDLLQRIRTSKRWQFRKRSTAQFPDWLRSMVADLATTASPTATSDWGWGT